MSASFLSELHYGFSFVLCWITVPGLFIPIVCLQYMFFSWFYIPLNFLRSSGLPQYWHWPCLLLTLSSSILSFFSHLSLSLSPFLRILFLSSFILFSQMAQLPYLQAVISEALRATLRLLDVRRFVMLKEIRTTTEAALPTEIRWETVLVLNFQDYNRVPAL